MEPQDFIDRNPLHWAVHNNCLKCLRTMLPQATQIIEEKDGNDMTPLNLAVTQLAVNSQTQDMILGIEALLQAGADPLSMMQGSLTSLHIAAANGLEDVLQAFLNAIRQRKEMSKF